MKVIISDKTLAKIADNKHKLIAEYGEERANKIMGNSVMTALAVK